MSVGFKMQLDRMFVKHAADWGQSALPESGSTEDRVGRIVLGST